MDNSVKRGDIFYADLSPVVGSEQGGVRPVLIVQNDISKPKGNEITNVNTNSKHVSLNPSNKYKVTSATFIFLVKRNYTL